MIEKLPGYFKDPHLLAKLPPNEPILLALSGGADSSALLYLLCELRREREFPLYAAHVNHGIRTEKYNGEADRDERFCTEICEKMGVELFVHISDVPAKAAAEGKSLETAARDERYAFFSSLMKEKGIRILATAHNADDNFETQLFNLCRGCGIEGICGIPETRSIEDVEGGVAVRPILGASKSQIVDFCAQNGIEYVTDSTNFEDDCVRNKLRLDIIPKLKEVFGSPEKSGARLSRSAREDNDFITSQVQKALGASGNRISLELIRSSHPAVSKRMIASAYNRFSGGNLEASHINILLDFALEGKNGAISLPARIDAVFENEYMSFDRRSDKNQDAVNYLIPLHEGFTRIEGTPFALCLSNGICESPVNNGYSLYATARVKCGDKGLFAANRREGDLIIDGGMHKKVKKLMCDKKVPQKDRAALPLIRTDEEILFVPQCAIADKAKGASADGCFTVSVYKMQNKSKEQ